VVARTGWRIRRIGRGVGAGQGLRERGPLLITHWGLSGPAILRLSAWGARELHRLDYRFPLHVNWLPHLGAEAVAEALQSVLGAAGGVARVGGEEFALLAPPSAYDDLIVKLIDLRARIEATPIAVDGGTIRTTISAGVALRAPGESFANLYRRADQALYAAKRAGRNCLRFNASRGAIEPVEQPRTARTA